MKKRIKIGFVGLGRRGLSVLDGCLTEMSDVEIKLMCDQNPAKIQETIDLL